MEGGGKQLAYSYGGGGGAGLHHDAKLLKSFSSVVEPRKLGLGLFAGLLMVTCAYFSTAKFDVVDIAMSNRPVSSSTKTAVGISSPVDVGDSSKQPQVLDLGVQGQGALSKVGSKAEAEKDYGGGISNPSVVVAPEAPPDEKDDDPSADAVLPPLSSDSADSTQESGVLEDEELKVQNALAAAANPPKNSNSFSSSTNGSSLSVIPFPSDPAEIPAPSPVPAIEAPADQSPEIKSPPTPTPEIKASPVQLIPPSPEVKQADREAPLREWKPLCDVTSNHRIDWCELDGDVRVVGANATVTLVAPPGADGRTFREESWSIKPYPRKADPNAMRNVRAVSVRSVSGESPAPAPAPACTARHDVPALVFSVRGYTGNYFHAYTDVVLPLFLTARRYSGEVLLLVADHQAWWVGKYLPVFKSLSNYEVIDLNHDPRVHCFRRVQVGLTSHDDFSIDPRSAPNGYSMLDFTAFLRAAYGLPRAAVVPAASATRPRRRPRLLVIARAGNRRFVNVEELVRGAEKVGFEAVVSEGGHEVAPFAELANSCDAMVGVHGAGLTNMVFLPTGGVVIQVLPLGPLEFVASYFRGPSRDMGLRYLVLGICPRDNWIRSTSLNGPQML